MWETIKRAFRLKELRKRIWITLFLFILFRLGTYIPVPGIDRAAIQALVQKGGFLALLDLFSGGGFGNFSIFALSVIPYINASIILQLLTAVIPALERLAKEGEAGQKKMARYTRQLTIFLATLQAFSVVVMFQNYLVSTSILLKIVIISSLVAGSYIVLWLGEIMTDKGIGNGVSLIIFAGIVSRLPVGVIEMKQLYFAHSLSIGSIVGEILGMLVLIVVVIFAYQAERRIPVQYAKRIVGRKVYGGQSTYIPLRLVQAGVLPIIFAVSVMMFPQTLGQFWPTSWFTLHIATPFFGNPSGFRYNLIYFGLIVFFTYFYTSLTYDPIKLGDDLQKYGGFIPGIRPGTRTAEYIAGVLNKIVLPTSIFLGLVAIVPNLIFRNMAVSAFVFGGTSVLIIIGVSLETVREIEAYLLMRHYKGFLK
ncbi:MAG: preprotein translocase subunit SecY [Caldisericaceae bacterium]|nr:preprotein translocase subunit SecY [Caldisericaceae bacterium]